jgi:hypothetical protein
MIRRTPVRAVADYIIHMGLTKVLIRSVIGAVATFALASFPVGAQWLDLPTPGIPRTSDGKPDLKAPVPRTADGKPDLSGLWLPDENGYSGNVIQEVKDEAIFRPEAEAVYLMRVADFSVSPHSHCLPEGPHQILGTGGPDHSLYRIMQSPNMVAILFEGGGFRQVFLDGRTLPKDLSPTWNGYSIGHWDRDTLVVESAGFNDISWLDEAGHPHTEDLRVTERFQRTDFGHMRFEVTFDDPKVLIKPLTRSIGVKYAADTEMLEYICNEGERDSVHYRGKTREGLKLSPATLARYVGTYASKDGTKVTMVLSGGLLFMGSFPMVATTETLFESADSNVEFMIEPDGKVTHFIDHAVEGDVRFDRKP